MELRKLVRAFALAIVATTTIAAGTLIGTTTYLHRLTRQLEQQLSAVHAAEEIELNLLLHARSSLIAAAQDETASGLAAEEAVAELWRWHGKAVETTTTAKDTEILAALGVAVERYLSEHDRLSTLLDPLDLYIEGAAPLDRAFAQAEQFLQLKLDASARATRRAERLDTLANVIGVATGVLVLVTIGALMAGARSRIYRPLQELRGAIAAMAQNGDPVRAKVEGSLEIREIAQAFNRMMETLERHRRQQFSFLAGVAHDLRNPLGAIRMATATLPPIEPDVSVEHISRVGTMITRQVDLLSRMITDLLDATRIEAGELSISKASGDARDVVHHVVELFRASSTRHDLVEQVPDAPLIASFDALRIEQVMNNLVSNAIKYSPSGGRIHVSAERVGVDVLLSVRDEGLGIPHDEHERIFEPFRRSNVVREGIPGVGIGLAVARRIVVAHGGSISLESTPGHGSRFTVRLPGLRPGG